MPLSLPICWGSLCLFPAFSLLLLLCTPEGSISAAFQLATSAIFRGYFKAKQRFDTMMLFVKDLVSLYTLGVNETQLGVLEYSKTGEIVPLPTFDGLDPIFDA